MNGTATSLSFQETGYFSRIIVDYLNQAAALQPFYVHPVSIDGIKAAIQSREQFKTDRKVLVDVLKSQYQAVEKSTAVQQNIDRLAAANTFTITTAHQPAIFTGTLYFIYKILHAIKLAAHLSSELPHYQFVPVYYMGSEDADLDELGNIYLDHEKINWDTTQTGAVGRMHTKGLDKIIDRIEGEYGNEPFGKELITVLKTAYLDSPDVQTATFKLVNLLFSSFGLIVLIPDNAQLKKQMLPVFEDDLFNQVPSSIVANTVAGLAEHYKVQANPRDINLFYLEDGLRGRMEKTGTTFAVHESPIRFSEEELKSELQIHPERFSPNVILRGIFQETILPNIGFIGGGGETAYWLELKDLFQHYQVPFPVLVLRNSFLFIEKKWQEKIAKAGLSIPALFQSEESLVNTLVKKESDHQLSLDEEAKELTAFYDKLKTITDPVDITLSKHIAAIHAKALKPIKVLEKKILNAEKRRFEDRRRQIHAIKSALFPLNSLQERIDNFIPYYAKNGNAFIELLYQHSHTLEQDFVVIREA